MRIELRKIDYSASLSQETTPFSADIWIDGIKEGHATNHGQGGPTLIGPGRFPAVWTSTARHCPSRPSKAIRRSCSSPMASGSSALR